MLESIKLGLREERFHPGHPVNKGCVETIVGYIGNGCVVSAFFFEKAHTGRPITVLCLREHIVLGEERPDLRDCKVLH